MPLLITSFVWVRRYEVLIVLSTITAFPRSECNHRSISEDLIELWWHTHIGDTMSRVNQHGAAWQARSSRVLICFHIVFWAVVQILGDGGFYNPQNFLPIFPEKQLLIPTKNLVRTFHFWRVVGLTRRKMNSSDSIEVKSTCLFLVVLIPALEVNWVWY